MGVLRVGATAQTTQSILAGFLSRFRRLHPGIEVRLTEEGGVRLLDLVEEGALHLAISAVLGRARLQSRPLFPIRLLAVCGPRPNWKRRRTIEVADLANEPLLLLRRDFGTRGLLDAACGLAQLRPRIIMESADVHSLVALAKAGPAWPWFLRPCGSFRRRSRFCRSCRNGSRLARGAASSGIHAGSCRSKQRPSSTSCPPTLPMLFQEDISIGRLRPCRAGSIGRLPIRSADMPAGRLAQVPLGMRGFRVTSVPMRIHGLLPLGGTHA